MEKELTSVKEARSHLSRSHPFVFESPIILAVVHARKTLKKKKTYTVERRLTTTSLFRPLFLARQNGHTFLAKKEKSLHLLRRLAAICQGLTPKFKVFYQQKESFKLFLQSQTLYAISAFQYSCLRIVNAVHCVFVITAFNS